MQDSSANTAEENTCAKRHFLQGESLLLPVVLFVATCASTFFAAGADWRPYAHLDNFNSAFWSFWQNAQQGSFFGAIRESLALLNLNWSQGLSYMLAVMAILLTHEMGHFIVAMRYGVPASLPFFIPLPILPFGTMGAVISMEGSDANRRQLFDLGTAGPLAGLAVALPISWIGIKHLSAMPPPGAGLCLHNPLILQLLIAHFKPDYPTPTYLFLNQFNPFLMAGWVGMFVTGLNMLPISQLDGGHVAYSLLDKGAHALARAILIAAMIFVLVTEQYGWVVMLVIVILMGIDHPPTADNGVPLNPTRRAIGWLSLLVPILCLSPIAITQMTR
ncbi:MAG: site-2 protease family protein [Thermoguttaceae bacterium]